MASSRDVVGFRRIFVLFCTLVLLPAMLLSGFGVIAIQNARRVEKQNQLEKAEALIKLGETAFISSLEATQRAVTENPPAGSSWPGLAGLRAQGLPIGPAFVTLLDGTPRLAEPPFSSTSSAMNALKARIIVAAQALDVGATGHLAVTEFPDRGAVSLTRTASGHAVAYFLSHERIEEQIAKAVADEADELRLSLDLEREDTPPPFAETLERWMTDAVSSDAPPPDASMTAAQRDLRPPFERYTLTARGPPPGTTTMVVYIVLMAVFYVMLITGVVITSRLIWEETRLSRLKTDFVSHVSHELRTPLTSIRMFIDTLRMGRAQSDAEREECFELLTRETERLSEMIERVLGYARLKSGSHIFDIQPTDVNGLFDDAVDAFRAQTLGAQATELDFKTNVASDLPALLGDGKALTEALVNLLGNAFKYTGPEKKIRLFARRHRGKVLIGVRDNGPGLPKSELRRVFDRFYQGGALLSRSSQGSGLGLAITRAIVEGQRGKVWADSELGKGSTFFIELPAARS